MLRRTAVLIVLLGFVPTTFSLAARQSNNERWNETRSIEGLQFCAFVLRVIHNDHEQERTVYVLMGPREVNEYNLHLLFKVLSEQYPSDATLKVWAYTDVEQMAFLATGAMVTSSPAEGAADSSAKGKKSKRLLQLALYKRTNSVEFFRYNPDHPKAGEKTVIIRGKEN